MEYFKIRKIISKIRKVRLSENEKEYLRNDFFNKIGYSESESLFARRKAIGFACAFSFMAVVMPIAYASEQSLPGDVLYPIKTSINEPIKKAVHVVIGKNKDDFEIDLLQERIDEAEELINTQELDDIKIDHVQRVINKQIEKSIIQIEKEEQKEIRKQEKKTDDSELENILENIPESVPVKEVKSKGKQKVEEVLKKNEEVLDKIKINKIGL